MAEHQLNLDEVGQELYDYVARNDGGGTERYLVRFLCEYVATEEELVELAHHRLSVWHLLNGECRADFDPSPYFRTWNERSGLIIFPGV